MPEKITITLRDFPLDATVRGISVAKQFLIENTDPKLGRRFGVIYGSSVTAWKSEMWVYRTKTGVVVRWIAE